MTCPVDRVFPRVGGTVCRDDVGRRCRFRTEDIRQLSRSVLIGQVCPQPGGLSMNRRIRTGVHVCSPFRSLRRV